LNTQHDIGASLPATRRKMLLSIVKHRVDVERVGSEIRQVRIRQRDWLTDKLSGLNAKIPYDEVSELREHLKALFGSLDDLKELWVITSENRHRDINDLRSLVWDYFPNGEHLGNGVKP
jgi:hypothetical protein